MMPNFGQISRLVSLVLAGLILTVSVELPTWTLPLIVLDSPLTLHLSSPWLIAVVLAVLVCAGTDALLRRRPAVAEMGFRQTAPAWVLPGTVAVTAPLLIARFQPLSVSWFLVLVGTGIGLSLALLGEVHAADPADRHCRAARAGLTVLVYAAALLIFTAVFSAHVRTVLSGTATALTSLLLAMSLLRWPDWQAGAARPSTNGGHVLLTGSTAWPFAVAIALVVGLATWGLNHIALDDAVAGGLLLLVFYVAAGIAQQFIQQKLSRRVLIEFTVAVGLALLLLFGFSKLRR